MLIREKEKEQHFPHGYEAASQDCGLLLPCQGATQKIQEKVICNSRIANYEFKILKINHMRPLDIVILMKLISTKDVDVTNKKLATELGISASELSPIGRTRGMATGISVSPIREQISSSPEVYRDKMVFDGIL